MRVARLVSNTEVGVALIYGELGRSVRWNRIPVFANAGLISTETSFPECKATPEKEIDRLIVL